MDALGGNAGWVILLARVFLGGLLAAAGMTKLRRRERLEQSLEELGLGGRRWAAEMAQAIPWLEAALGLLLLLGLATRLAGAGATTLMVAFAAVAGGAAVRGLGVDLRCGPGLSCRATGWTVARNLCLAGVGLAPALLGADWVSADHLLLGAPAQAPRLWDGVPVLGLALYGIALGYLLPAIVAVAGQLGKAREA
jgi:uncharacterized membrane protein YphA (DoxX/SURF4 family)